MTPAGLVLAAGSGQRLGGPKALVRFEGQLLVERAVATARSAGLDPIVVVLGASAAEVVDAADLTGVVTVVNDSWADGMGSSLRCGLRALTELQAPAAVVLLVDQPYVGPAVIGRLVAAWVGGAQAAVATYDGQARNPALVGAQTWPDVARAAVGDVGARGWLRAHPDEVTAVPCDDLGSGRDIDTQADLQQLIEGVP